MRCVAQFNSRRGILARTDLAPLRARDLDTACVVSVPTVTAATGKIRKITGIPGIPDTGAPRVTSPLDFAETGVNR